MKLWHILTLIGIPSVSMTCIAQTLNVPVTIPPPKASTFTQAVSQAVTGTVTIGGQSYSVSGTLSGTLTCTPTTPVASALSVPVIGSIGPLPNGKTLIRGLLGDRKSGSRVEIAGLPAEILSWSNDTITVDSPPLGGTLLVWSSPDSYFLTGIGGG